MADLLTMEQAAKQLAISAQHLRREFVNKGILAVVSLGKGCKGDRIDPQELARLVVSRSERRCFTSEETLGGSSLKPRAKLSGDPLGQPASARLKRSSAH